MRGVAAVLLLALSPALALAAQSPVTRAKRPTSASPTKSPDAWSSMVRYNVLTDFADNRTPRSYVHSMLATLSYNFNPRVALETTFGARAETIDGQVSKGREQTYDETLGPSTSFALSYANKFWNDDQYALYLEGEPLWDEASRQEGYKGLVGAGGNVSLRFFAKRLVVNNDLSVSELINTYHYGSNLSPNPDYFITYKLSTVVKIYRGLRASYSFGAKMTRYMDDFTGYSYSNSTALSYAWPHWSVALAYDNGGFTDEGTISLWYLDQYRRLARFVVGYTF